MKTLTVTLPWPPTTLSPNARLHHMALYRAKKAYANACAWHAHLQGVRPVQAQRLRVLITFNPPNKRTNDKDNLVARMKAGIDAMARALCVDDGQWHMDFEVSAQIAGTVVLTITEDPSQ